MTGYVTFEGRIEPMVWGRSTYTILRIPPDVLDALGPARRVEGEIAEHPVNLAPTRAPVIEGAFLWAGQSLLDRIGIAPGDVVEVRLRPAPDDRVDVPDDLALAMRAADVISVWEALTPGKRRGLLYKIDTAKTEATRQKRIGLLVAELSA
jgi:Bacteriocin-protection, YdeI or OmpD-Associated